MKLLTFTFWWMTLKINSPKVCKLSSSRYCKRAQFFFEMCFRRLSFDFNNLIFLCWSLKCLPLSLSFLYFFTMIERKDDMFQLPFHLYEGAEQWFQDVQWIVLFRDVPWCVVMYIQDRMNGGKNSHRPRSLHCVWHRVITNTNLCTNLCTNLWRLRVWG